MNFANFKYQLLIVLIALLLFVPFLGAVHLFDWDEINFAECAREMIATGNYFSVQINFQPFWEKPPLFIWMQALSMNSFGINEFSARLPNAICGIITLLVLFNIGKKLYDVKFGLLWVLVYAGSFLPHFYFKSGIIDPWFNLFIFCGIYYFILFGVKKNVSFLVVSALFIGLAVLTKGPVAVLIVGLCVAAYWAINRFQPIITFSQILIFSISTVSIGGLWFLLLLLTGNVSVIKEFFIYQMRLFNSQDSGHGGFFFYHWVILLVGCFPSSIFALRAFFKNGRDLPSHKNFKLWMMILFWIVLILFSIVKTKIVHYSSLCYFPLSFLSAYTLYKLLNGEMQWKKAIGFLMVFIASLIGIAIMALPFVDKYKYLIINSGVIHDTFAVENMKANVYWSGYEWLIGAFLITGTIVALMFIKKGSLQKGLVGVFTVSLITVNLSALIIAPRIEQYSQRAAIEFYEQLQNKDCYVETLGFKSYAHLFYSHKKPPTNKNSYSIDWLLNGVIDKPVYFVSRINNVNEVKHNYPQLKELYRKNGFVFFTR